MIQAGKKNTKFGICKEVRKILLADETVHDLVGEKIYPIIAPEGTKGSFITYTRASYSTSSTKMGIYGQECEVGIACVSNSYDRSVEIAEAVFQALQGYHPIQKGDTVLNSLEMSDSSEDFVDGDVYIQYLSFRIV